MRLFTLAFVTAAFATTADANKHEPARGSVVPIVSAAADYAMPENSCGVTSISSPERRAPCG